MTNWLGETAILADNISIALVIYVMKGIVYWNEGYCLLYQYLISNSY